MLILSNKDYQMLIKNAHLQTADGFGPKVYQLADGRFLKLFRSKRRWSLANWFSYALRFKTNSDYLQARAIKTVDCEALFSIPSIERTAVVYQPLGGQALRDIDETSFPLENFARFFAELHEKGIYFRSCHLANIYQVEANEFGLIDVADTRFSHKPLSWRKRARNFRHLLRYEEDVKKLRLLNNNFWRAYAEASSLPNRQFVCLKAKVAKYILSTVPSREEGKNKLNSSIIKKGNDLEKYLIVAPSWVGDMVMAHTMIQALAKKNPNARIDVIAPKWTHPLVSSMPEVNQVIELPFKHGEFALLKRHQLAKSLRERNYTHAIVLPNSFKSALIPWLARIPKRIGWRGEFRYGLLNDIRKLDKKRYPLMIERFMALADKKDAPLPKNIRPRLRILDKTIEDTLKKFAITDERPFVFAPGAEYGEAKRWPAEYYADLARSLSEQGEHVWFLGSANDKFLSATLMRNQNSFVRNFIGETSLNEAMVLLWCAQFVVSNDSGLMHIAAAFDKAMIAIYGSSDTRFTPPLSEKAKVISLGLSCSPCFERRCPLQHLNCLQQLSPEYVMNEIQLWKKQCVF